MLLVIFFGLCFKFVLIGYNFYILMFFVGASTVVYFLLDSSSLLIYDSVTIQGEYTSRLLPLQDPIIKQTIAVKTNDKAKHNKIIKANPKMATIAQHCFMLKEIAHSYEQQIIPSGDIVQIHFYSQKALHKAVKDKETVTNKQVTFQGHLSKHHIKIIIISLKIRNASTTTITRARIELIKFLHHAPLNQNVISMFHPKLATSAKIVGIWMYGTQYYGGDESIGG
ncbi:hypothetical protein ACJX0J_005622, partial [Zea mays]